MIKLSLPIVLMSMLAACTPIPERTQAIQTPRPVAPLPVETLPSKPAPQLSSIPKANPAKPATTKGKPPAAALSASNVKALLQQAEDKAISAASLGQSAQTQEDWNLVISQWKRAIALLKQVTPTSPQATVVQKRLAHYQSKLTQAQHLSVRLPQSSVQPQQSSSGRTIPLIIGPGVEPSPSPTGSSTPIPDSKAVPSPSSSPAPTP